MSIHWLGYAGTTLVVLAYLPQIMHLIREHCSAGLSHKAYATWVAAGLFLLSYAIAVGDTVFIALQGYQLTAATLICFLCKKYEGQLCEEHGGAEAQATPVFRRPLRTSGKSQGATLDDQRARSLQRRRSAGRRCSP
jgi:uncharacterized protein with PQ loop repeat